jgi:hypothetical protein
VSLGRFRIPKLKVIHTRLHRLFEHASWSQMGAEGKLNMQILVARVVERLFGSQRIQCTDSHSLAVRASDCPSLLA